MENTKSLSAKRVFISYCWGTQNQQEWAIELGNQLTALGILVELDVWSTVEGQDLNVFMETMVTDPTIDRVIIISDHEYAEKANARKGGVGRETQIISEQVYGSVSQTKFVAIVRGFDQEGKPFVPVFWGNRKYIDFSRPEEFPESLESLVRNIYDKPLYKRPALGTPPAYLSDTPTSLSLKSALMAQRYAQAVNSGRGSLSNAAEHFLEAFLEDYSLVDLVFPKGNEETWCDEISRAIDRSLPLRNVLVDFLHQFLLIEQGETFAAFVARLLEGMMPMLERRTPNTINYRGQRDPHRFFCYESSLYLIALLVRSKRYTDARRIFEQQYAYLDVLDETHQEWKHAKFDVMNTPAEFLDVECARKQQRLSLVADHIMHRATRKDVRFHDLMQADVLSWLMGAQSSDVYGWYPSCLVLSRRVGALELFARATTKKGYEPLESLLNMSHTQMIGLLDSEEVHRMFNSERLWRHCDHDILFNVDGLKRIAN